jgi:hypothetical protein
MPVMTRRYKVGRFMVTFRAILDDAGQLVYMAKQTWDPFPTGDEWVQPLTLENYKAASRRFQTEVEAQCQI